MNYFSFTSPWNLNKQLNPQNDWQVAFVNLLIISFLLTNEDDNDGSPPSPKLVIKTAGSVP